MSHPYHGLNELRELFLQFFETKGHLRLPSFSLVPQNDKSILLINAGMTPMKPWFKGEEEPPRRRVCTCQKCIRTGDIDNVGKTARHGTYFEMLGNFSFGDYFKHEAIAWSWEFLTSPQWVGLEADRLYPSIYLDDDEAFDIWNKEIGIPKERIFRFGKEDNFWEHGSGPCGPCSEIYFDRGPEYGCGKPTCGVGCDCDRYMEIWNLVFSQFDADGKGHYERLARPNIDTGMGLERLACVMQNVGNLFEVDTVQSVLHHVEHIAGKTYKQDPKTDISIRVITDHIRSCTFMVSDGILPSNEGRGYVLRRLLRRAARHGRMLGIDHPFLVDLVETVIQSSESAYPELREHDAYIKKVIGTEELRFGIGFHPAFNVPFDAKHTTTDYEFRFDQPESPVILDARPNGLLSGKSYYQWKNQQAIQLTDDLFANDSFCMAGLRTGTIGICEKDTGRNITCRVEGYPYSLIWSAPAKPVRFVCIEPWHSLPAAATDPQDWEQRAAAACLAPGESWQTTLSTTFDR